MDTDDRVPQEGLLCFPMHVSQDGQRVPKVEPKSFTVDHEDLHFDILDYEGSQMRNTGCCEDEMPQQLWAQKSRMDALFDQKLGKIYYEARSRLWPQDCHGSDAHWNRAGDKLREVHTCDKVRSLLEGFEQEDQINFLDVCGGPGAFSQLLLNETKGRKSPTLGFGITLKADMASVSWYPQLLKDGRFNVCWGDDGTGNVYIPANLQAVCKVIETKTPKVDGITPIHVVVSDGGFEIQKIGDKHMENLQELFSCRIILAELLMALKVLCHGGHFVCKMFDTFSYFSQSLVFVVTQVFAECYIVKPLRSRLVNSERYLVGKFLQKKEPEDLARLDFFHSILNDIHGRWYNNEQKEKGPEKLIRTLVPLELIRAEIFSQLYSTMVGQLCSRQTKGIRLVMDEVDKQKSKFVQRRNSEGDYQKRDNGRGYGGAGGGNRHNNRWEDRRADHGGGGYDKRPNYDGHDRRVDTQQPHQQNRRKSYGDAMEIQTNKRDRPEGDNARRDEKRGADDDREPPEKRRKESS